MASSDSSERPSTPMQATREDSVTPPDFKPKDSPSKKFSIQSILNPSAPTNAQASPKRDQEGLSLTPASPSPALTTSSAARSGTPGTPSSVRGKKAGKDNVVFNRGPPTSEAKYLPFELSDQAIALSTAEQRELARQHRLFRIKPSEDDGEGQIRNFTRYIPYSSDKKNFFLKTGKEGFNVFLYTFHIPDDPSHTEYTVMWDYGNGLTRITPFFKACGHTKTIPQKALSANADVKELAHSITGGALAAQGYWIPYACARAICLTFCYDIRWALTPIFGPSFIRECLPPGHDGWQKFKVDPETIRNATLEAEGWKQASMHANSAKAIPRSVPQNAATALGGKELRPRDSRSMFKSGSPFQSDDDAGTEPDYDRTACSNVDSPRISPKTSAHEAFKGPTWTSINGRQQYALSPARYGVVSPLNQSLLNQPHQYASWRNADPVAASPKATTRKASLRSHRKHKNRKRHRSSLPEMNNADTDYNDETSRSSSSESDDIDIICSPKKRVRRLAPKTENSATPASAPTNSTSQPGKSVKFTPEDYRVARLLLELNRQDDQLALGPDGLVSGSH